MPMDAVAEKAVIEAIETLIAQDERAYAHNVPTAAVDVLIKNGCGRISQADTSLRVREAIAALERNGRIHAPKDPSSDWLILGDMPTDNPSDETTPVPANDTWDIFVSHANEDKEDFVRPLAERLDAHGLSVWFDEFTLMVGDSLRRSIDHGLAHSRFGVVVISPDFLRKEWPKRELDGLVAREVGGTNVILPVWHNITAEEIRSHSPMLADRLATSSSQGMDQVIEDLTQAIKAGNSRTGTGPVSAVASTPEADVRVTLQGTGTQARFVIENRGPATAHDVNLTIESKEGREGPMLQGDYDEKLPAEILRSGAHIELIAALTFGAGTTFSARWSWTEDSGATHERREKVSLQSY